MNRFLALLLIMILTLLIGCSHPITDSTTEMEIKGIDTPKASFFKEEVHTDGFDIFNEAKAVAKVLKDHPDFPEAGKSIAVERIVGGPAPGTKVSGRATTSVAALTATTQPNHDVYFVTLNREWNMKINGNQVNGNWIYKVDRHNVELVKQEDNEKLLNTIK